MGNLLMSKVDTVKFYSNEHFNDPVNIKYVATMSIGSGLHENNKAYDIKFKMADGNSIIWLYKDVAVRDSEYREIKANFGYQLGESGFW